MKSFSNLKQEVFLGEKVSFKNLKNNLINGRYQSI